jgi:putative FmdB family regulatory protein
VPFYEYKCPNGHLFESFHSMSDPGPQSCEVCGASPLERVLHPVAVHYKGSGFYSTDYGRGGRKAKDSGSGGDSGGGGGDSGSGGGDSGSSGGSSDSGGGSPYSTGIDKPSGSGSGGGSSSGD